MRDVQRWSGLDRQPGFLAHLASERVDQALAIVHLPARQLRAVRVAGKPGERLISSTTPSSRTTIPFSATPSTAQAGAPAESTSRSIGTPPRAAAISRILSRGARHCERAVVSPGRRQASRGRPACDAMVQTERDEPSRHIRGHKRPAASTRSRRSAGRCAAKSTHCPSARFDWHSFYNRLQWEGDAIAERLAAERLSAAAPALTRDPPLHPSAGVRSPRRHPRRPHRAAVGLCGEPRRGLDRSASDDGTLQDLGCRPPALNERPHRPHRRSVRLCGEPGRHLDRLHQRRSHPQDLGCRHGTERAALPATPTQCSAVR